MYTDNTTILLFLHRTHRKKYILLQRDERGAKEKSAWSVNNLMIDDVLRDDVLHKKTYFVIGLI